MCLVVKEGPVNVPSRRKVALEVPLSAMRSSLDILPICACRESVQGNLRIYSTDRVASVLGSVFGLHCEHVHDRRTA